MRIAGLLLLIGWMGASSPCAAQEELVVGTKHSPPFSILQEDGTYTGITIELWKRIAEALGYTYRFETVELAALVDRLTDGSLDASAAALTLTVEREKYMDFTHSFYSTGLAMATRAGNQQGWWGMMTRVFSAQFITICLTLAALLLGIGILIWALERRRNPADFGGVATRGIGEGFWWAAVTMTTVGYGDRVPKTAGGRFLGLVWMFMGVILISVFTASITSSLTVSQLESGITGPQDLPNYRVATVRDSTSAQYLGRKRIPHESVDSIEEALQLLDSDGADIVLYDAPILRWHITRAYPGKVTILPYRISNQTYAIGLPQKSPITEDVNQALLEIVNSAEWERIILDELGS